MLHLNTINKHLYEILKTVAVLPELKDFYLVGGTSLALQVGHRISDDLDFFTDKSFPVQEVRDLIINRFPNTQILSQKPTGLTFSLPGENINDPRPKLEIYNWAVKFIRAKIIEDKISLASLEDIAAFKLDAICYRKEKKDFVDIAVLLNKFSFGQMMAFHKEKYPYSDSRTVLSQIGNVQGVELTPDPVMLIDLNIKEAIHLIHQKASQYSKEELGKIQKKEDEKIERIRSIIKQKKEPGPSQKKGRSPRR